MVKNTPQKRKTFSDEEVKTFFEELNRNNDIFSPTPSREHKGSASDWVTTGGSSKRSNELIKVTSWQTGQAS